MLFCRLQTRLSALERAATLSLQIERQLGELEAALRGDGDSLRLLDQALAEPSRAGALPTALREHASASIRDVARLLSDKQQPFDSLASSQVRHSQEIILINTLFSRTFQLLFLKLKI